MSIDNSFIKKRITKMDHLFVLFSPVTHLPFVECDEETFDDQVYVFTTEEMTQTFARSYTGRKIPLQAVRINTPMFQPLFSSLYLYGVTAVMLQEEGAPVRIPLTDLAEPPALDAEMAKKLPVSNPPLQLTALYFMQELRRQVTERDADEKKHLQELEEEMAHNMLHSDYIVTFDTSQVKGEWNPKDKTARVGVPMIKTKTGKAFQPVFTEVGEFRKFMAKNKDKRKMRLVKVPFDSLPRFLTKDAEGFILNPAGFNLILPKGQVERIQKLYGEK